MSTTDQHPLVRIIDGGGGMIPLVALVTILWGIPWAKARGFGLVAWAIAIAFAFLSGILAAERAAGLFGDL